MPGLGFLNARLLPRNQQTQIFTQYDLAVFAPNRSDGMVDTELRYRFGATNFGGTIRRLTSPTLAPFNIEPGNGILNEGTFTAATGRDFERAQSTG